MINQAFWQDKKVFLTGHTGFKGAWLSLWLLSLGAKVYGYSDNIRDDHFLYRSLNFSENEITSVEADICNLLKLKTVLKQFQPDIVIHMAAQSLVRESYLRPILNFNTNIMGTCNVLEAIRDVESVKACLVVTTDKCYENLEQGKAFVESDKLGGEDPYSASKACAEIVTNSYRQSFFQGQSGTSIATARAGNVIGGGDMSKDRIIPDIIRSYQKGAPVSVRSPLSIRPWQHVIDCLCGYMMLCERLYTQDIAFASAWNFGPGKENVKTVEDLLKIFSRDWPEIRYVAEPISGMKEALLLALDASKARENLSWQPRLKFDEAVSWASSWYRDVIQVGVDARSASLNQLNLYQNL
ncbi:MAG: CDP-glucose 4,6-dehydratase [Alphaproteobacteria bacterium]|nr:CDP-glucose 4,6-dehydratase [Alphaproteobacteria bacterium]